MERSSREAIDELQALLTERSIKRGDFRLASGDRSAYYFDSKATALSPKGTDLIGSAVFRLLEDSEVEAVGGLAMGATFITVAVALVSWREGRPIYGFNVRDQKKGHGLENDIDQSYHPSGQGLLVPERKVAVVDDVVTKGGSVQKAIDAVSALGCSIVRVLAIVDRQAGGGDKLREQGLPYEPIFVADTTGELHVNESIFEGASWSGIQPRQPRADCPRVPERRQGR